MLEGGKLPAGTGFASAGDADRRIAGVAAAARAVKRLADDGAGQVRLLVGDGILAPATLADIERVRGDAEVVVETGQAPHLPLLTAWEIMRATGKPGDGLVSRWLNRPISRRISWLLLLIPALRPIHITAFNALLAPLMLAVLAFGGHAGLIAGGILFHLASVLDGVDGEMARATFRTTPRGATLDSAVDMATNFCFLLGFTINLWQRDGAVIGSLGIWSIAAMLIGNALIARRARAGGAPLGYDLLKRSGRIEGTVDLVYWLVQTLSSRDCFAFLFMVLILVGLEWVALFIFAGVAAIWFPYVLITMLPRPAGASREADA
ncbi:CDP-alcohol phosphatidyltransferase family protein [Sphingosinicella sp.]|uniref:CDP-alcohol phosphatidyltransferase family protein n=1 Tax=Sphingosinicella sp. TaxID=1917971 RepID=UPI004037A75F